MMTITHSIPQSLIRLRSLQLQLQLIFIWWLCSTIFVLHIDSRKSRGVVKFKQQKKRNCLPHYLLNGCYLRRSTPKIILVQSNRSILIQKKCSSNVLFFVIIYASLSKKTILKIFIDGHK